MKNAMTRLRLHCSPILATRRYLGILSLFLGLPFALISGCGGGVGTGGTGVGSYTIGSITGFGSIIVNSVRYDDSTASVTDDDDGSRSNGDLRLGMRVEVEGDGITTDSSGSRASKASRIRVSSEMVGPVQAVDVSAGRLTVLGQTVLVVSDTVLDDSLTGGLSALRAGTVVEVHALFDPAENVYRASRIEPARSFTTYKLRGVVAALDTSARTLRMGQATVLWTPGSVPADVAVGQTLRLTLATQPDANGRWLAQAFGTAQRSPPDRPEAEIKGLISNFTSVQQFTVNGIAVDASSASFPDGTSGLRLGARVEVKGRSEGGRLLASTVELETDTKVQERGFDFRGQISAVDTAAQTITVRGQIVSTARSDLRFDNGTRSDLRVNREVDVKATLGAAGARLEATRITFR
jgi:Domain of unknown function (DUF5666)